MARATKTEKVVTVTEGVTLELTMEEARALRGLIGGLNLRGSGQDEMLSGVKKALQDATGWRGKVTFVGGLPTISSVDPNYNWGY